MIAFTDASYSGLLTAFKIVTKSSIFYVGRILHSPLSEITDTCNLSNLMQGSVRDFSVCIIKNIPLNKTNITVCCKKNKENQGHSVDKEQYAMGEKMYINAQAQEIFGVHKNKLAYLQFTLHTV